MGVAVISFLAFGASQVGSPGPANMVLLATGARFGFRRALPFVAGVVVSKQLIIWPIGFGLMQLADTVPGLFTILKWACVAYILWLAWRIANSNLQAAGTSAVAPGFMAGLLVHPLNPKAWAMIIAGFTTFVTPGTPALQATAIIAICLAACQLVLHPLWTLGGQTIAKTVAGRPGEKYLMWGLAALTVASVFFVLILGGAV